MAVIEKSIIAAGGGDYTTVASWEAGISLGGNIHKGEIQDDSFYQESLVINVGGSASSYAWLTVHPDNRHYGVTGAGASVRYIHVDNASYTHLSWLEIHCDASSNDGIKLEDSDHVLIDYCIIRSSRGAEAGSHSDGIVTDNGSNQTTYVSNCIIYGWARAGILSDSSAPGSNKTKHFYLDHNTIISNDYVASADPEGGPIYVWMDGTGSVCNVYMYNNIFNIDEGTHQGVADGDYQSRGVYTYGQVNWYGSNNSPGVQTDTDGDMDPKSVDAVTLWKVHNSMVTTTQSSGTYLVVKNMTHGSEDFLLLDDEAGNSAAGNGVNRQGSEPDPRQDFSIDIKGCIRPTTGVDIGAHQYGASAPAVPIDETGRDFTIVATISEASQLDMVEAADFTIVATLDGDEAQTMAEATEFVIVSTIDMSEQSVFAETLGFTIVSTVDITHELLGPLVELGLEVVIVSTVDMPAQYGTMTEQDLEVLIQATLDMPVDWLYHVPEEGAEAWEGVYRGADQRIWYSDHAVRSSRRHPRGRSNRHDFHGKP